MALRPRFSTSLPFRSVFLSNIKVIQFYLEYRKINQITLKIIQTSSKSKLPAAVEVDSVPVEANQDFHKIVTQFYLRKKHARFKLHFSKLENG